MLTTNPPEKVGTMLTVAQLMEEGLGGTRDTLFEASTRGDIEHVRYMLDKGASPNAKDFDGDTVLSAAAEAGEAFIVALMLNYGAEARPVGLRCPSNVIEVSHNTKRHALSRSALCGR